MTDYAEHKRIESADGQQAVSFEKGDHGLCRFVTWKLYDPAPDLPALGGLTWVCDEFSGLYPNLVEAEKAAMAQIVWLGR